MENRMSVRKKPCLRTVHAPPFPMLRPFFLLRKYLRKLISWHGFSWLINYTPHYNTSRRQCPGPAGGWICKYCTTMNVHSTKRISATVKWTA